MTEFAIQTRALRKSFGGKVAVRSLDLEVRCGEIFGFLGPNGAGKSTSIKLLLGLAHPSGGNAEVLGRPAGDVATRRRIGFLPEEFRFYGWLTAEELLRLHGRLCGMEGSELRTRIPELIEMVGLAPHRGKRLANYSKGMLQRIGLAQAMVHRPELVFLDEPTSGLDPMGRRTVRDIVRSLRDQGVTVFLNSHLLSEIEVTCDRVVFLRDGAIVATHDLAATAQGALRVTAQVGNASAGALASLPTWSQPVYDDGRLTLQAPSRDTLPELVRLLTAAGVDIYEFSPGRTSLEEMFLTTVGKDAGL